MPFQDGFVSEEVLDLLGYGNVACEPRTAWRIIRKPARSPERVFPCPQSTTATPQRALGNAATSCFGIAARDQVPFFCEKVGKARMGLLDLSSAGPFVTGQKKGSSPRKGELNERAESS
jgi:hypothetical protein